MTTEIKADKKPKDYWEDDGMVYVTSGLRWGVSILGQTVCMGRIDGAGVARNAPEITLGKGEVVQKVKAEGNQGGKQKQRVFAQERTDNSQVMRGEKIIGRPMLGLPVGLIGELHTHGADVAEILRQLKDKGYQASRRAIYNILAAQRVMISNVLFVESDKRTPNIT